MAIHIRKLGIPDLIAVEEMAAKKIAATGTDSNIFQDPYAEPIYKHFILDEEVYGSELFGVYGCFDGNELIAVLGYRCIRNEPSWVLSFVITSVDCTSPIAVIKQLMERAVYELEQRGYFQWFVVSRLDKFKAWQKLFRHARLNYHHYVYSRTKANELPRWNSALALSGNKLFPYDTNISMYISKRLCTIDDDGSTVDIDEDLL